MDNLMISKNNQALSALLSDNSIKIKEIEETIVGLNSIDRKNNRTLNAMLDDQKSQLRYQQGYRIGLLKALIDTMPPELAKNQTINNVPLGMLIKLKIDEEVLEKLEKNGKVSGPYAPKFNESPWYNYRRFCELICGYGYNMYFLQERFEECFPNGMHNFIHGFADAYSTAFHAIAAEAGISTERTETIQQDIWKNWQFFFTHEVTEYRLDGSYMFMYHGGINVLDSDIPYGNNVRVLNTGVYEKLQSRSSSEFTPYAFKF